MHLQHIENGLVINHHPFGIDLQAFAMRNLDVFRDHGFMDGGCLALAQALMMWTWRLERSLVCVGRENIVDHVALAIDIQDGPLLYLDGDGMGTSADLVEKMKYEGILNAVIRPLNSVLIKSCELIDYHEVGIPTLLLKRLRMQLGDVVDPDQLSLSFMPEANSTGDDTSIITCKTSSEAGDRYD